MDRHYDLVIIEQGPFGGTCLNAGCIPSKMYVHTADTAGIKQATRAVRLASRVGGT